jgi:hypothetical protein
MNKTIALVLLTMTTMPLAACAGDYGYGVADYGPGPYSYDGYYDGYYGPIYDGYWGSDNHFYYRHGAGDRGYVRGDRGHFSRDMPQGGRNFQPLHGTMTPGQGMHMPHFPRGGGGNHRH